MGNMQRYKSTNNFSEIGAFAKDPEMLTSSLSGVMGKFMLKSHLEPFDVLKSKGLAISSLVSILVLLPFYGISSVYAFVKSGIMESDIQGKKDAYYDAKNNESIDWRKLLFLHAKRFRYLMAQNVGTAMKGTRAMIFDDTPIEKTGKKTEKLSLAYDHVSNRHIFGFKLLVCGFWDGGSFVPLDFSFHREKGAKNEELIKTFKKTTEAILPEREDIWVDEKRAEGAIQEKLSTLKDGPIKLVSMVRINNQIFFRMLPERVPNKPS